MIILRYEFGFLSGLGEVYDNSNGRCRLSGCADCALPRFPNPFGATNATSKFSTIVLRCENFYVSISKTSVFCIGIIHYVQASS